MLKSFFGNKEWALWAWGGLAFLLISLYTQVSLTVFLNEWYKIFYDILQKPQDHSIDAFWEQLGEFFWLAAPYVLIATITSYFTRLYAFAWREAITFNYIPRWRNVKKDIEGASQRIQEDAYRFARIVESLGLQVVKAIMTLIAFIPILWGLSEKVELSILEGIEGSLVWGALLVSIGGLVISWFVGWFLPGLEYNNQKHEAAFRKELVLGEDDKRKYAHEDTLLTLFIGVKINYRKLFMHYGYFDIWLNMYSQIMIIVPYVIMGPSLFTGTIMLGILVQVSNAFQKVHGSFSLFLENWTTVTELRSIYKRLSEFEDNLTR